MDGEEQATTWCRPSSVEHHEDEEEEEEEGAIIAMAKAAMSELKVMSKRARLLGFPSSRFSGLSADRKDRRRRALQFLSLFSSLLFIYWNLI